MQHAVQACAHCNLSLEPAAHCEPWGGLRRNWSLFAQPDAVAGLSLAQSLTGHWLMLGFGLGQRWFTYLCGKGRNNHNDQADHLLCLIFLKPQISSTKYLDLHKGKVFPVCIIQMWVTICLKLGNTIYMLAACFPYVFLYSFIRSVRSCLLSWAEILNISVCTCGPFIVLQSDVKVYSRRG